MRRGQSTLEYIVVIGSLAAALIVMGVYMNRGFQGNVRGFADSVGEQFSPESTAVHNTEQTVVSPGGDYTSQTRTTTSITYGSTITDGESDDLAPDSTSSAQESRVQENTLTTSTKNESTGPLDTE